MTVDLKAVEKLAKLIKSFKDKPPRIVFANGAGISTACGIPDFRTPGTGLYDNLSKLNLPYAEAVFDIEFFEEDPKPFYLLAKDIYPGQYKPSKFHYFIKFCDDKKSLKRCYTQNIDTLERLTGLKDDKLVEAHGSFGDNHCIKCHEPMSVADMSVHIKESTIPKCEKCKGLIKPDIVFFGEALPERFWTQWDDDLNDFDLLIVCGTSLQVHPFAGLPCEVGKQVKRVLINKELVGDFKENPRKDDIVILGDIEEITAKLVECLGWDDEFWELIRANDKLFSEKKLKLSVEKIKKDLELGEDGKKETNVGDEGNSDHEEKEPAIEDLDKELSELKIK